jgi:hypothetical protein
MTLAAVGDLQSKEDKLISENSTRVPEQIQPKEEEIKGKVLEL